MSEPAIVEVQDGPIVIALTPHAQLEADLAFQTQRAAKAEAERDAALKDAAEWKREWEMYSHAWLREMGGKVFPKAHRIDAYVITTRYHYARSMAIPEGTKSEPVPASWKASQHASDTREASACERPNTEPPCPPSKPVEHAKAGVG